MRMRGQSVVMFRMIVIRECVDVQRRHDPGGRDKRPYEQHCPHAAHELSL